MGVAWCVTCSVLVLCVSLRASRRGRVEACAKMREDGGMGFGFATTDARVRLRARRTFCRIGWMTYCSDVMMGLQRLGAMRVGLI